MKVKGIYNERGSQSESGSKWKWLYNKSECGSDYAMKGSESYYTLKVKVKGVVQWKGSEMVIHKMRVKVKAEVVIWKWNWQWLYNESESASDYTMNAKVKVIIWWEWRWLYNESENESDYTMEVKMIIHSEWESFHTDSESDSAYTMKVKVKESNNEMWIIH